MKTSRARFRITGRVQGVGFRWFVLETAERLGLSGWVKNEGDGSVSCEAQGADDALSRFADELRRGPRFGNVRGLEREELPISDDSGFEIR